MTADLSGKVGWINRYAKKNFGISFWEKNGFTVVPGNKKKVTTPSFFLAVTAAGHIHGIAVISFCCFQKVCNILIADT